MRVRTRTHASLLVVFAVMGFLLVTQLQAQESLSRELEQQSVEELTSLIGTLTLETDRMQTELADLSLRAISGRQTGESDATLIIEQQKTLTDLRVLTGATPGFGRGARMSVSDPHGELEPYDLLNLVNELRSAGAEAVVIGGHRVDFRTSFTGAAGAVAVNGVPLRPPYTLDAVGNPDYLASSLVMAGGVAPSLENRPGVSVVVTKEDVVSVPAFETTPVFRYAAEAPE